MWQRFSEQARIVVFYAQEEAQKFGEGYVSTEHILLGLLRTDSTGTKALSAAGINASAVRAELERHLPRDSARPSQDMTLTPRSKRVIDLAYEEARELGDNFIGTEHLLLGIIVEADGLAGKVLSKFGIEADSIREWVRNISRSERNPEETASVRPAPPSGGQRQPASYQLSALIAIRQQFAPADYLALLLLAEGPADLSERLSKLGQTLPAIKGHIEREILAGPHFVPGQADICELITDTSGVCELFLAIATHPSTFTRKAFDSMGITQEQLRNTLKA